MAKPLSILYFTRNLADVANEVAAAIRIEGNLCNLAYAGGFRDESQAINCDAVVIQQSAGRAQQIADAYASLYPGTEIHFYTDDGEFVGDDVEGKVPETTTEEEATDEDTEETSTDTVASEEVEVLGTAETVADDNEESVQGDANDGVSGLIQ